jgi:hypothetical protein
MKGENLKKNNFLFFRILMMFIVSLLMVSEQVAFGGNCIALRGTYAYGTGGNTFITDGEPIVISLEEVGTFTAHPDKTLTGSAKLTNKFPDFWVLLDIEYSNGTYTFNNDDCTGTANWLIKGTVLNSSTDTLPPGTVFYEAFPVSMSFVVSDTNKKVDFIITSEGAIVRGSATKIKK